MARGKSTKLKPFQKLLLIMQTGKPVTIEEIDKTLGKGIYMYRLSTYMWHIKTQANGIVKAVKDGRKVTAYQIVNVADVKDYMKRTGVDAAKFVPGKVEKKPSVAKLADLKAKPVKAKATKQKAAPVAEEIEVTEVTTEAA